MKLLQVGKALTLTPLKQGFHLEVESTYGDGDITETNSLVLGRLTEEEFIEIYEACLVYEKTETIPEGDENKDYCLEDRVGELVVRCPYSGELGAIDDVTLIFYRDGNPYEVVLND